MRYKYLLIILFLPFSLIAQDGGQSAFSFINSEYSARAESMGGSVIAIFDNDVCFSGTTPSLLNRTMDNELAFTFGDYFSDINLVSFSYARYLKNLGMLGISLKAIDYGAFERNDEVGNTQGSFSAHDQVLTIGFSKELNKQFNLGMNISMINSIYDIYNSFALSSNISATYFQSEKRFTSTLLFKNIGRQLSVYSSNIEILPFEIQFALSKELKHLPFRYHISYSNINRFDIKSPYKLIEQTNIETGNLEIKEESIAKTALRHIVIGGEFNPFRKNLFIRGGFNFQRRFDMTIVSNPAAIGFSWGVGFKVLKYNFNYSRSLYHLSGVLNNFSIATNLSTFGF